MAGMDVSEVRGLARHPWVDRLGRVGWATKGLLYAVIGLLALGVARGRGGGERADQEGAIAAIAGRPFGTAVLVVVAVGLFGYALWRVTEALLPGGDAEDKARRVGYVVSALAYAGLGLLAVSILRGRGGGGGDQAKEATARLLGLPFGRGLVGLAGVVVVVVGLAQAKDGVTRSFTDELATGEMGPDRRRWVERLGVVGMCARAVAFALIGSFLVRAALRFDPDETQGLDGALRSLVDEPYGPVLLALVALGLLAYGLFCFAQARYRRVG